MVFLDIHTHQTAQQKDAISIQSLSLTSDIFLAMPKTKPISIGLHPWFATTDQLEIQIKYMSVLANQANVKLIGECGLDKLRGESIANQILIFEKQVEIAEALNKPMLIHCVRAFSELVEIKKRLKIQVPLIIHGFNKNLALGKQLLAKGFMFSFGIALINEKSEAAKFLSEIDVFFLETDDADVSIHEIYIAAAKIKKCSVDVLKARIFANWNSLNL